MRDVVIAPMERAHIDEVAALAAEQAARWHMSDGRLRVPSTPDVVATEISRILTEDGVEARVALDPAVGKVVACGISQIRELSAESEALAFMGPRDAVIRLLALPAADEGRREQVTAALLDTLAARWREQGATGANMARPVCDDWVWPLLEERRWIWTAIMGLRPPDLLAYSPPANGGFLARMVEPQDVEAVVAVQLEQYAYHEGVDPTVRVIPALETEIRAILDRALAADEEDPEDGRLRIFVVELDGEVVASSIAYRYVVEQSSTGFIGLGNYCHIGSTGVRSELRGQGVGRALVDGIIRFYEQLDVQGYTLWYHLRNPLSSMFWPKLGWVPLVMRFVKQGVD